MNTIFKNDLDPTVLELNRMNEELQAENEQLKKEVADYHQLQWRHDALIDENERLKTELKKWEDRSKVVKDGFDGEVYEWGGNYYIVTPHLNVFVKGLLKENAKLKCLALHLFGHLGFYASEWYSDYYEERKTRRAVKWWKIHIKYNEAYRKAKAKMKEGKYNG